MKIILCCHGYTSWLVRKPKGTSTIPPSCTTSKPRGNNSLKMQSQPNEVVSDSLQWKVFVHELSGSFQSIYIWFNSRLSFVPFRDWPVSDCFCNLSSIYLSWRTQTDGCMFYRIFWERTQFILPSIMAGTQMCLIMIIYIYFLIWKAFAFVLINIVFFQLRETEIYLLCYCLFLLFLRLRCNVLLNGFFITLFLPALYHQITLWT